MRALNIVVATIGLLIATPAFSQSEVIKVATEGAFAPWNMKDAAGKLVGFEMDLLPDLCQRMGVKCEVLEQAWGGIIPNLNAGRYDAIMAAMSITQERRKAVLFTRPYAAVGSTFATLGSNALANLKVRRDYLNLDSASDEERRAINEIATALKGKTLGVNRATTNESFVNAYLTDKAINVQRYENAESLDLDLISGRVDAAVVLRSRLQLTMSSARGQQVVKFGPDIIGGPFGSGTGIAVRLGDSALAERFSKAIAGALQDETVARLTKKWFGFDATPR
jgi:octopine/nopaline transport system substrate-binding protein